jgi:hypothetical protein
MSRPVPRFIFQLALFLAVVTRGHTLEVTASPADDRGNNAANEITLAAGLAGAQALLDALIQHIDICSRKGALYAPTSPLKDADGCLAALPSSPSITFGITSYAGGSYGVQVGCPANTAVTAVCTSGKDADCAGRFTYLNCTELQASPAPSLLLGPTSYVQASYGVQVACPANTAVTSVCTSGKDADCAGYFTYLNCSRLSVE